MQTETHDSNIQGMEDYLQEKEVFQDQSSTSKHPSLMNGLCHDDMISSIRNKIYKPKPMGIVNGESNRRYRSIRKLTQKALKTLKIKVSDYSKEIQETKQTVNDWFKKKIEDSDEKERIILKSKEWLQNCMSTLDYKKFYEIAQKYVKSEELEFNVNQIKKNPNIQEFSEIPFSTVLQKRPPGGFEWDEMPRNLALIRLKIPLCYLTKKENSYMTERLYWDIDDEQTEDEIFKNLTIILLDLFNESYSNNLKNLLYQELMVITQICYFQLIVQLEYHQKIQSCWNALFESGFDIFQEPILLDGTIHIKLHIKNHYNEEIQWDTSYNQEHISEFSQCLVIEQGLDKKYAILIASQISTQVQKFIEQKLDKLQDLFGSLVEQQEPKDIKIKLNVTFKDNIDIYKPCDLMNQTKYPQNHELQVFFKKYVEYLPNEISKYFGFQNRNDTSEICIDMDDLKRNESQFNLQLSQNQYMDASIYRELTKGSLNKTLILK